jgi:glycosyltransferase involved in cell wall biosynthesis
MSEEPKRIALFYYTIVQNNAIGRCNRTILEKLCDRFDFTVFSARFDNPRPDRIKWVRIPCPLRPMALSYLLFRILALAIYVWGKYTKSWRFDLTQGSDSCVGFTDGSYVHFCHRVYLRQWAGTSDLSSLRGLLRTISHFVQSALEGHVYRRARFVVVPSKGLWRELAETHAVRTQGLVLILNPVDIEYYSADITQKRAARLALNLPFDGSVLVFVALGHFERKGLGPLIKALADARLQKVRLLVVGGSSTATEPYRALAENLGLGCRIAFFGNQEDPRRFFWASDAFILPSRYEVFPLVALEAAASGLPLITTHLNGIEEFARAGETGFFIKDRSAQSIADAVQEFLALSAMERSELAVNARSAVSGFGLNEFASRWEDLYRRLLSREVA